MTQSEQELKISLVKAIAKWADREGAKETNWPQAYFYNDQSEDMAEAAFAVFMASVKAQEFYKENN